MLIEEGTRGRVNLPEPRLRGAGRQKNLPEKMPNVGIEEKCGIDPGE